MSAIPDKAMDIREDLQRFGEAARDAVTDEMVTRLAGTAGDAVELIDLVNRSGLAKAIPVLTQMVANGDLDRLVQLARVYGSAEDALTDEMVGRIAETIGEAFSLLDRLSRGGAVRFVEMMERMQASGALERMAIILPKLLERMNHVERVLACLETAEAETHRAVAEPGGFSGLWRMLRDPETQKTLQFLLVFGKQLRTGGLAK